MQQNNDSSHFAIKGRAILIDGVMQAATLEIKDGIIHQIHDYEAQLAIPCEEVGDASLLPGLVDCHVHINEPGRTDWEGFTTATQAAAAGGITTLVDMPLNCIPATVSRDALEQKLEAVGNQLWVDCGFWGGVTPDSLEDLPDLLDAGVLGVKSFLIDSGVEEFPPVTAEDIRQALPVLANAKVPYLIHAELDKNNSEPASIGDSYQSFLASRPKSWENDAIELMIQLLDEARTEGHDGRVHIVHLSSDEGLTLIENAQEQGLNISAETCPHYLTLIAEKIPDGKTLYKCCPPIRESHNCENLWQGLIKGTIDFIVSDHSPCTPTLKLIDSGDIEKAWGGISALQFSFPLIWTEAEKRGLTLAKLSEWMSWNTAEFTGLSHFKGKIAVGYQADFMLFDEQVKYQISRDMIKHKHKITPYESMWVTGRILKTWLAGQCIYPHNQAAKSPLGRPLLKGKC